MAQWTSPTAEAGASDNRNATTEFVTSAVNVVISAVSTAIGAGGSIVEVQATVTVTVSQFGTSVNIVTATLSAGTWDCTGLIKWDPLSTGPFNIATMDTSISTVSNTHNLTKNAFDNFPIVPGFFNVTGPWTTHAGPVRVVLTVSGVHLYLVGSISAAGTDVPALGYLQAESA